MRGEGLGEAIDWIKTGHEDNERSVAKILQKL